MSKFIIPFGLALGGLLIVAFLIIPGWQHFLSVRADTRYLLDVDTEIDALIRKRDSLVDQMHKITKQDFQRLDQVIPFGAHGPEFLLYLQQLALSRGLSAGKLDLVGTIATKPKIASEQDGFSPNSIDELQPGENQSIVASMEVGGSYEAFKDFLRDVESYTRITDLTTLVLGQDINKFTFKLTLKTYYQ